MTKIFSIVLALTLVSIITVAGTATASAKGKNKQPIDISAILYVTGISDPETNLNSGWSKIESETLQGGLITVTAGPAILQTTAISAQQSSHEQFTSTFLPAANVKKGKSKGTFYLTSVLTGETLVVGKYDLKVSSTASCQISGEGKWKAKAKNSIIDGKGKISVCTNFVPTAGTFVSSVSVTGNAALVD
jgi:hypothetical protein